MQNILEIPFEIPFGGLSNLLKVTPYTSFFYLLQISVFLWNLVLTHFSNYSIENPFGGTFISKTPII